MADPPPLMHATQVTRPFHTPGWIYEEKYDGWRMLAVKEGRVRLVSRNERCRVEARPARCMILFVMADEPSMSGDPTQGYFRKHGKWVRGTTRQAIREALGHDLPVGFNSPMWTQCPLTPGPDWSRHGRAVLWCVL